MADRASKRQRSSTGTPIATGSPYDHIQHSFRGTKEHKDASSTSLPVQPQLPVSHRVMKDIASKSSQAQARTRTLLEPLSEPSLRRILLQASEAYPHLVCRLVRDEADRLAESERTKVVRFSDLSARVDETLNYKDDKLKDSHAFEFADEAGSTVTECIKEILEQCHKESSYETKSNALEALRKISVIILESYGVIGHEVRKDYFVKSTLMEAFETVAGYISLDEARRLKSWVQDKLVELRDGGDDEGVVEGLHVVVDALLVDDDEEEEDSNEDHDESQSDSELCL